MEVSDIMTAVIEREKDFVEATQRLKSHIEALFIAQWIVKYKYVLV